MKLGYWPRDRGACAAVGGSEHELTTCTVGKILILRINVHLLRRKTRIQAYRGLRYMCTCRLW